MDSVTIGVIKKHSPYRHIANAADRGWRILSVTMRLSEPTLEISTKK